MSGQIVRTLKPEEEELSRKREEFAAIRAALAERELELADARGKLAAFEAVYLTEVGALYAELDEWNARIAELREKDNPSPDATQHARDAREQARQTGDGGRRIIRRVAGWIVVRAGEHAHRPGGFHQPAFVPSGVLVTSDDEKALDPTNDTLNAEPPKFGMPWYVILGILCVSVLVFLLPHCKVFGAFLCPCALVFGW